MKVKPANLSRFSLDPVLRKMDLVNEEISSKHTTPFPKDEKRFLSHYRYKKRYIEITPQGEVVGGLSHMFVSLIDLSFFRSVVAEHYGKRGYYCYDPCSFICLDICGALDSLKDTASLCRKLRHPNEGLLYRSYAGIDPDHIPSEDDFTNFRKRVGEDSYNQVLHALVDMAYLLGFLAGGLIASTDGYLVPTYSRFRGCDHFSEDCLKLHIENLIPRIKQRVSRLLNNPEKIKLGKNYQVRCRCPSPHYPEKKKKPMIKLLTFSFSPLDPNQEMDQTVKILGMEEKLREIGLSLSFPESNIQAIKLDFEKGTSTIRCPHCPTDLEASRGVRRSKKDPSKLEFVFGYNAIRVTLINPRLGFEAPCEAGTYTGNTYEGDHFISLRERIKALHPYLNIMVDLGDGKYDNIPDYDWCRESDGSEPLFDYNVRNEKIDEETLKKRGYDKNGTPFATCGLLTKWRGYDPSSKRSSFSCEKQCLSNGFSPGNCPHLAKGHGFSTHMSVAAHPRLILRWHRGTSVYKKIRVYRSASERTNSLSDRIGIITRPRTRGIKRIGPLVQRDTIVILLKKMFSLIVKVTQTLRMHRKTGLKKYLKQLFVPVPKVPLYILLCQQRK